MSRIETMRKALEAILNAKGDPRLIAAQALDKAYPIKTEAR